MRRDSAFVWLPLSRVEKTVLLVAALVTLFLLSAAMGTTEPAPVRGPVPVTEYEDGSLVWSDGTTSCPVGAPCQD